MSLLNDMGAAIKTKIDLKEEKIGTAIASASTITIGTAGLGNYIHITGTTTITSLGTASAAGIRRTLIFDGALTLTHNATSLICTGGANIVTVAGTVIEVIAETTTNWRVVSVTHPSISMAELGYLDGVTSAIQTQINGKASVSSPSFTGSVTIGSDGTYVAGSIFSNSAWGMIFRAKQASPTNAIFRWADAADTELFRWNGSALTCSITGNATTATKLTNSQSDWESSGAIANVVGMLGWKNYNNRHVIFDASASTSPSGSAINNTNPQNGWSSSYPTLMGWNGSQTYGVRVDAARYSESCTGNAATATTAANANQLIGKNWYWSGQGGQPTWLWGGSDGTNMYVYNPSNFSVNYANSAGTVNSLGNYACKAWGNINGTGVASIRASGNLSSVSDLGVGYYGINFASAMPDANYAALVTVGPLGSGADHSLLGDMSTSNVTYTNTGFRVNIMSSGVGPNDKLYVNIAVFR